MYYTIFYDKIRSNENTQQYFKEWHEKLLTTCHQMGVAMNLLSNVRIY